MDYLCSGTQQKHILKTKKRKEEGRMDRLWYWDILMIAKKYRIASLFNKKNYPQIASGR